MAADYPLDISNFPDLARLTDEVERTGHPWLLRKQSCVVTLLVPAAECHAEPRAQPPRCLLKTAS